MNKYPKQYETFISLGKNCEFAFQFQHRVGKLESNLFSWAAINDQQKFVQCLKNIDDLFMYEIEEQQNCNMWKCSKYSIVFHGRNRNNFSMLSDEKGNRDLNKIKEEKDDVISRVNYLKQKFKKTLLNQARKLFVLTAIDTTEVQMIHSILESESNNFNLLVIFKKSSCPKNLEELNKINNIDVRFLEYFSPYNAVASIEKSDKEGWRKIFNEFKLLDGVGI